MQDGFTYYLSVISLSIGLVGSIITNISTFYNIKKVKKELKKMESQMKKEKSQIYEPTFTEIQKYGKKLTGSSISNVFLIIVMLIGGTAICFGLIKENHELSVKLTQNTVVINDLKNRLNSIQISGKLDSIQSPQEEKLNGMIGSSGAFGSGWLDFNSPLSLHRGDTLNVRIGGTAKKVVVRLLGVNNDYDSPEGIEGGVRDVPANKMIEVILAADRNNIKQISVHGRDAFGKIGEENGPATLISVKLKRHIKN